MGYQHVVAMKLGLSEVTWERRELCFNGLPRGGYTHTREAKEKSRNIRGKAGEW